MSLLERLQECNNGHKVAGFIPFHVGGIDLGWIGKSFAGALRPFSGVFECGAGRISLAAGLDSYEHRSAAVSDVLQILRQDGLIPGWRDEAYPVGTGFYDPPLFEMERAAIPYFGIPAYGIHVNGYIIENNEIKIWIARRAEDKPTYPGQLDNMVAGGQPVGIGLMENVIKEAAEEASIPYEIASQARPCGAISYRHLHDGCLKPDTMFVYDMEIPPGFVPQNDDGEVASFELLPVDDVRQITASSRDFKFNCAVVNIDFMIRHGVLTPDQPDYLDLVHGLRR